MGNDPTNPTTSGTRSGALTTTTTFQQGDRHARHHQPPELGSRMSYPLLTSVTKPWDEHGARRIGRAPRRRAPRTKACGTPVAAIFTSSRYAASRSFRLELLASDELDGAADVGVEPDKACAIAEDFLAPSARTVAT